MKVLVGVVAVVLFAVVVAAHVYGKCGDEGWQRIDWCDTMGIDKAFASKEISLFKSNVRGVLR